MLLLQRAALRDMGEKRFAEWKKSQRRSVSTPAVNLQPLFDSTSREGQNPIDTGIPGTANGSTSRDDTPMVEMLLKQVRRA
jgi:hypothetical protein